MHDTPLTDLIARLNLNHLRGRASLTPAQLAALLLSPDLGGLSPDLRAILQGAQADLSPQARAGAALNPVKSRPDAPIPQSLIPETWTDWAASLGRAWAAWAELDTLSGELGAPVSDLRLSRPLGALDDLRRRIGAPGQRDWLSTLSVPGSGQALLIATGKEWRPLLTSVPQGAREHAAHTLGREALAVAEQWPRHPGEPHLTTTQRLAPLTRRGPPLDILSFWAGLETVFLRDEWPQLGRPVGLTGLLRIGRPAPLDGAAVRRQIIEARARDHALLGGPRVLPALAALDSMQDAPVPDSDLFGALSATTLPLLDQSPGPKLLGVMCLYLMARLHPWTEELLPMLRRGDHPYDRQALKLAARLDTALGPASGGLSPHLRQGLRRAAQWARDNPE